MMLKHITPEMTQAGQDMASLLMDASIIQCLGGCGGCSTGIDIPDKYKEIVQLYLGREIMSVDGIYAAIKKEKNR